MKDINQALKDLNITLPNPPAKAGLYVSCKTFGEHFIFCSGHLPHIGEDAYYGQVGKELTLEQGQKAAENCVLNLLASLKSHLGDLSRIKNIIKLTAFVSSPEGFYDHPKIANGASSLLISIFGEEIGTSSRSAVGVPALPGNAAVEIEMLVEFE